MPIRTNPKVSIIMPVYNGEEHLAASIRSVILQSYRNIELIVVNDGSTDGSEDIIRTFMNRDDRIKYIYSKENKGVAAARNKALKAVDGEWIAYLDSDDIAATSRIERCMNFASRTGERCIITGGWFRFMVEKDQLRVLDYVKGYLDKFDIYAFQNKNLFACSTVIHHKDCLIRAGIFDEELDYDEDWDLWLRISDDFPVYQLDEPLVFRRVGEKGDRYSRRVSDKDIAEGKDYLTEKRIKKLLEIYSRDHDTDIAKKIFYACFNVANDDIRKEILGRLDSWKIYNTIAELVKTAPRQAFELLERHKKDKLISYIIREKVFDFSVPMADLTNEDFQYIKQVLESFVGHKAI